MSNSATLLRPRWTVILLSFGAICALGFTSGRPSDIVLAGAYALLAFISFGWISNWCMPHLLKDGTQEFICSAVWFGLWAGLCTLLGLSSGWILYGAAVAFSGYAVLVAKAETVILDLEANRKDFMKQRNRLRLQGMTRAYFRH